MPAPPMLRRRTALYLPMSPDNKTWAFKRRPGLRFHTVCPPRRRHGGAACLYQPTWITVAQQPVGLGLPGLLGRMTGG